MRAVRIRKHGGPDVLALEELPRPTAGEGQVLVEMRAAALNHIDLWVRRGIPGVRLPTIMGSDGAGVIVETGPGVTRLKAGDEVMIQPGRFCGACVLCRSGRVNLCPQYGILGETEDGVQAEYVALSIENIAPKPSHLTFAEAASIVLVFLTAYQMLVARAALQPGETVLVVAGSSGLGSAAVQVAREAGGTVIATASGQEKVDFVKSVGAHEVVDHYEPGWYKRVKSLAGPDGVQVVVEHVGAATWDESVRVLGRGGRIVVCGATSGPQVGLNLRHLFHKHLSVLGSTMGDLQALQAVLRGFEDRRYTPQVDRVYSWEEVADAHRYLENKHPRGKVVLSLN